MSKKLPLLYKFILCLLTVLLLETPLVLAQGIGRARLDRA